MDTIQIEVTNACVNSCSNCTRLCGHHRKPFFMSFGDFTRAVDSLAEYPGMVGIMGGEPLLHPEFDRLCNYLHSKRPPEHCGLWSTFPSGKEYYARLITETFWNVLLNDHSSSDIPHTPVLTAAREYLNEDDCWYEIHHCGYQNRWSASITPRGAYFCEVAAALDMILETNLG
jgi:organic radical activating enzyme